MAQVLVQKLHKSEKSRLDMVIRYFIILMATSDIHLTRREIELLAFTSLKGSVSSGGVKQGFTSEFSCSDKSMHNFKRSLEKKGLFIKRKGKRKGYDINPRLSLDFTRDVVLQITLDSENHGLPEDGEDKTK